MNISNPVFNICNCELRVELYKTLKSNPINTVGMADIVTRDFNPVIQMKFCLSMAG
jgi:hypothetical protein